MSSRQQQIEQTIDDVLQEQEGLLGMALVSRDGIPVLSRFTRRFDQKAFSILVESAMVATLMGAAEEAMTELEGGPLERVIVETAEIRMLVIGAGQELLMLVLTEPEVPIRDVDPAIRRTLESVGEQL